MNYADYFIQLNENLGEENYESFDKPQYSFVKMYNKSEYDLNEDESNSFDPMTSIPSSDEEVKLCFEYQQEGITSRCKYGLYKIYKDYDGLSLLEAYKKVLLKSIGEKIND